LSRHFIPPSCRGVALAKAEALSDGGRLGKKGRFSNVTLFDSSACQYKFKCGIYPE
jgi:hypothetical protein